MIKLKTKIVEANEDIYKIKTHYKSKNSNEPEHLMAINELIIEIMKNVDEMTIDKLCKTIKQNYKIYLKESECDD